MRNFHYYMGGKHELARRYGAPRRRVVVEPFAGSAGFSVFHEAEKAILIDKNERLIATWQWLINATPDDILSLDPNLESIHDCDYPQPVKDLIGWSFSSGRDTPGTTLNGFKLRMKRNEMGRTRSYWSADRQKMFVEQLPKIKSWEAHVGNYDMLDDRADLIDAHWFVDPPYQFMGDHLYRHNGKSIDFESLGQWCRTKQCITVCEGAPEGIRPTYLPFKVLKNVFSSQNRKRYDELVWSQGTEPTSQFLTEETE